MLQWQVAILNKGLTLISRGGLLFLCGTLSLEIFSSVVVAQTIVQHALDVTLSPDQQHLEVRDTITLPKTTSGRTTFHLNSGLRPLVSGAKLKVIQSNVVETLYEIEMLAGQRQITLHYQGKIAYPLAQQAGELRQSQQTLGTISTEGVYLDSASGWFARFDDELLTFTLDVHVPSGWSAVSQGVRLGTKPIRWQERQPQDNIFLIAAPFKEYGQMHAGVALQVFLRDADEQLAQRYLQATGEYLAMFEKLLGPYPYKKFALVENFWETGYGMPSFTLLGAKVIRLPFILHSSYPHELLHNWWGNSVYVDHRLGNWSEGLTAYLSDHLLQEQRGEGGAYRQAMLQKYSDFVNTENDFPLNQFKGRFSPASEAIGYGKTAMLLHSLRLQLGDKVFTESLRAFYKDYRFKRVDFNALRDTFSKISGKDLALQFDEVLTRNGALMLALTKATAQPAGGGYLLEIDVEQTQDAQPYSVNLPIAITLRDRPTAYQISLPLKTKKISLRFPLDSVPLRVDIDPEFDIFRRLDRAEIPAALGRGFGDAQAIFVLPSAAPKATLQAYRQLALEWTDAQHIVLDKDIKGGLPAGRSAWILGWENRYFDAVATAVDQYSATLSRQSGMQIGAQAYTRAGNAVALSTTHRQDAAMTVHFLAAHTAVAIAAMARKLPHYAKYSYVVFSASDMVNAAKGLWPITNSPLSRAVVQADGSIIESPRAALAPRPPLITLSQPITVTH